MSETDFLYWVQIAGDILFAGLQAGAGKIQDDAVWIVQAADVIAELGIAHDIDFSLGANLSEVHLLDILIFSGSGLRIRGPGGNGR